jgi:hypothetical protein
MALPTNPICALQLFHVAGPSWPGIHDWSGGGDICRAAWPCCLCNGLPGNHCMRDELRAFKDVFAWRNSELCVPRVFRKRIVHEK